MSDGSVAAGKPRPTRQRVLAISAELFNQHGVEAVSIGMIADHLRISPGNLIYHYRRKADLIEHHCTLLESTAKTTLATFPSAPSRTLSPGPCSLP